MPLTEQIKFNARLQSGNRVQVPKLIRWRFKLEPYQILKVNVTGLNLWVNSQSFYTRMSKDGRIVIPALPLAILGAESQTSQGTS